MTHPPPILGPPPVGEQELFLLREHVRETVRRIAEETERAEDEERNTFSEEWYFRRECRE